MKYKIQVEKSGENLGLLVDKFLTLERAKNLVKHCIRQASKRGFSLVILPA